MTTIHFRSRDKLRLSGIPANGSAFFFDSTAPASNGYNFFLKTDIVHGTCLYRNNANGAVEAMDTGLPRLDVYVLVIRWVIQYDLDKMGL